MCEMSVGMKYRLNTEIKSQQPYLDLRRILFLTVCNFGSLLPSFPKGLSSNPWMKQNITDSAMQDTLWYCRDRKKRFLAYFDVESILTNCQNNLSC